MKAKYLKLLKTGRTIEIESATYTDDSDGVVYRYIWERPAIILDIEGDGEFSCFKPDRPNDPDCQTGSTVPFAILDENRNEIYRDTTVSGVWF